MYKVTVYTMQDINNVIENVKYFKNKRQAQKYYDEVALNETTLSIEMGKA